MFTTGSGTALPMPAPESRREQARHSLGRQLLGIVGLYAVSRVYSTALLAIGLWVVVAHGWQLPWLTNTPSFALDASGHWDPHLPSFAEASAMWDGAHYASIAHDGYPVHLPYDHSGRVTVNNWAFLPMYPFLVGALAAVFGAGFAETGVVVSMLFGCAATVMLYLLVRDRVGIRPARFAAAVFAFGPLAYLLQLAYAESMFLFLAFTAMYLLQRGRYAVMLVPAVLAAFTRPGEVALALAVVVVFFVRLRQARRGGYADAFPRRDRVMLLVAAAVTGLAGLAWAVIAGLVTGVPNAYTATELSWRNGFLGHTDFRPFTAWFELGWRYLGVLGIVIVVVIVLVFAWWVGRRRIRPLGAAVLASASSYALYLIAVFMPQQSVFRVAMPLAPLMGDPALSARPALRRTLLVVAAAAQPVCVALLWFYANP